MVVLNPIHARVLGSLVEKEITTPEYYPLSLNALMNACNQKSSREPVMELSEGDVRGALSELEDENLVRVLADSRVPKFEHRLRDQLNLRRDEIALVCLLLLRGPQTAAELRSRAERLYRFDDNAAAQSTLERLAGRDEPIVAAVARNRWMHLLSGPVVDAAPGMSYGAPVEGEERGRRLSERVDALEARVQALEEQLARLTG